MPVWLFIFFAVLAIVSAFGVVLQRSPVHCLLALAMTLLDMGVLFMGLGAETVGFLQIIVYVGAIMVLFLFVIWLLNLQVEEAPSGHLGLKLFGSIGAALLLAELFVVFFHAPAVRKLPKIAAGYGSIASLARLMFSQYLVAFEVTSILLLVAIVGAVALARRTSGSAATQVRRPAQEPPRSKVA